MTKLEQLKQDRDNAIARTMEQFAAMEKALLNSIENKYSITWDGKVEDHKDIEINITVKNNATDKHQTFSIMFCDTNIASKFNQKLFAILAWIAKDNADKDVYSFNKNYGATLSLASLVTEKNNGVAVYTSVEYFTMNKAFFSEKFARQVASIIPRTLIDHVNHLAHQEVADFIGGIL